MIYTLADFMLKDGTYWNNQYIVVELPPLSIFDELVISNIAAAEPDKQLYAVHFVDIPQGTTMDDFKKLAKSIDVLKYPARTVIVNKEILEKSIVELTEEDKRKIKEIEKVYFKEKTK